MANKKLAIFDFCGTLYKFQSSDMYVDFAAERNFRTGFLRFICGILVESPEYNGLPHKKVKLSSIRGAGEDVLRKKAAAFIDTVVLPDLIPETMAELDKYLGDPSFDVVIASAGYNTYLEHFCHLKNIPYLVATNIEMKNGKATGRISGADCYGTHKVTALKQILDLGSYDLKQSACYSDSMTDKPIFDLVGNKFFVQQAGDHHTITRI